MVIEPAEIDQQALAAAREERIDWRFKGFPDTAAGSTVAEFAAARPNIFTAGFHPALMVLAGTAITHNIDTVHGWAAGRGIALAPHGKTTMAPELFARQIRAGAWAITAATFSQVRVYRAFGISRIVLANQLVDAAALRWIAAEHERDPKFEFYCWVDSVDDVTVLTDALPDNGFRLPVLVELAAGRTGVPDRAAGLAVAKAVAGSDRLRLAGVAGYEGSLTHDTNASALSTVDRYLRELRALAVDCAPMITGRVLVSAGGSAYFDQVGDVLTEPWPDGMDVLPVLRSGGYITHDSGLYERISPLGAAPRMAGLPRLRPAMRVWAQVHSVPEPGLALLTAGRRDVSFDSGLPRPDVLRRDGATTPLSGAEITGLNDQHGYCRGGDLRIGDWVGLGPSHPCTVFDKWQLIPVVDGDGTVTSLVRTYF